ncbi:MAG: hypothetical protein AAGU75_19625, partial [Bacillota bacterium]
DDKTWNIIKAIIGIMIRVHEWLYLPGCVGIHFKPKNWIYISNLQWTKTIGTAEFTVLSHRLYR